ncbi:SGNH/GDSL hydrolase family protein [Novosphingobium cyanobacteriorum]|uniref:SGNH/GDSL hydrolase family protein n=1 Tax=Novosphingobium cyanobacteriorum TaxID=3024215 RepID=A0ABT6CKB8_9SPHN|nr:SGNH/GDSL hydrolase family protein [Novosphingobium cyanobacteriorum]MDF8334246.1 SGNH/GDSL hydrolase family protein [Novosphingobium cyanobacteriorum]
MHSFGVKQALMGGMAMLCAGNMAIAQPVWREAFQSSPATYEAPTDVFIAFAKEHWRVPTEQLLADLTPQPISGTVRYQVTVQAEGDQIRLRLSNEEGKSPIKLNAVTVGLAGGAFVAAPGSLQPVTFGGSAGVTIPAGAPVLSDPVPVRVKAGTDLLVSAALAGQMLNEGRGGAGFLLAEGDQARSPAMERPRPMKGRPLLTGVSVLRPEASKVIVTFGDSITDGNRTAPGMLHGWPEQLAHRLAARKGGHTYTVVNAGIAGNRLLSSGWGAAGLARLDRDALRIEGISHLVLLEGINDINFSGQSPFGTNPDLSADELIAGYRQVIARAHARGVKVYIATLTPNPASELNTAAKVALREAVNQWIRHSGEPDAVIDFEAMVRDPSHPDGFRAEFDSGDHLHPGDQGYRAMGDGIDLSLFP